MIEKDIHSDRYIRFWHPVLYHGDAQRLRISQVPACLKPSAGTSKLEMFCSWGGNCMKKALQEDMRNPPLSIHLSNW